MIIGTINLICRLVISVVGIHAQMLNWLKFGLALIFYMRDFKLDNLLLTLQVL